MILVFYDLTLPHAGDGLEFYLTPDLSQLAYVQVRCLFELRLRFFSMQKN